MRKYIKSITKCAVVAAALVVFQVTSALAITQAEFLPKVHDALGFTAPFVISPSSGVKYLSGAVNPKAS